jgi:hypothetical protein
MQGSPGDLTSSVDVPGAGLVMESCVRGGCDDCGDCRSGHIGWPAVLAVERGNVGTC